MSEAADKGARILIVDDTLQNIQVLGTVLREENYQINVAQNGLQALDVVGKVSPDLILLDVMMPELDGFETCKRLKADAETRDIPVIFLTAKVETEDIVHGFELGAVDYVTKPFNATELLARVHTHLEIQRLRRELEQYNEQLEQKVQERTAEVRAAHQILERQVKELEGRDRLSHAQMSSDTHEAAYQEILQVVADVLDLESASIYRPDAAGQTLQMVAAVGLTGAGVLQQAEDLQEQDTFSISDGSIVSSAFADARPGTDGPTAAVPVLYGEDAIGVIAAGGLVGDDADQQSRLDTLWRLGREAALVLHTVEMNSDLESGELDVSALLDIEE